MTLAGINIFPPTFGTIAIPGEPVLPRFPHHAKLSRSEAPKRSDAFVDDEAADAQCETSITPMTTELDDAAFEELVGAHYEALYRFAFSLVHSEADARDLVQEAFAQLARKAGQLRSKGKAKSWLFTTLYRAFIDAHRREVRHPKVDMESAEPELPADCPDPGVQVDSVSVREALMTIDEVFRAPLVLFYLEGHSYLEIAEILNIPSGTVMSRISRGRAMLRRMFEEKEPVPATAGSEKREVPS